MSEADLLLTGAHVRTLDPALPEATAVAVRDGLIAAVGDTEDIVRAWSGPGTERVDLTGATLVPGLVDAHSHPVWGLEMATGTDLSMVASAFREDPLAHAQGVRNKTGTDDGVRADVGYRGDLSYAVLANWDPAAGDATAEVMDGMRAIGQWAMRSRPA